MSTNGTPYVLARPPVGACDPPCAQPNEPRTKLTVRETQVLTAIVKGMSNRRIGRELRISEHTVKAHIRSIFHKLRVVSRTQAAIIGLQAGVVPPA
ncbi:response regulator transcription factor [Streptomyces sp. NPDC057743]|uniref:response regulator transcription factor n=1 Tax=Streptomyces sp. NPDC057743 TaxID=3346236 RepID=UPI003695C36C